MVKNIVGHQSSFPLLPDDIERLIFECLVQIDKRAALTLVLVARHVQQWIEMFHYRTLEFDNGMKVKKFVDMMKRTDKPDSFFLTHVRSISVIFNKPSVLRLEDLFLIISRCRSISSFALLGEVYFTWGGEPTLLGLLYSRKFTSLRPGNVHLACTGIPAKTSEVVNLMHSSSLHLRHLSCGIHFLDCDVRYPDFSQPLYQYLTHLELALSGREIPESWIGLDSLVCLTHLTLLLPDCPATTTIPAFLSGMLSFLPRSLQIFIPFFSVRSIIKHVNLPWILEECDPRVVIGIQTTQINTPSLSWNAMPLNYLVCCSCPEDSHRQHDDCDVWNMGVQIQQRRARAR